MSSVRYGIRLGDLQNKQPTHERRVTSWSSQSVSEDRRPPGRRSIGHCLAGLGTGGIYQLPHTGGPRRGRAPTAHLGANLEPDIPRAHPVRTCTVWLTGCAGSHCGRHYQRQHAPSPA